MAKAVLLGAALILGCLVLAYGGPLCTLSVEGTTLRDVGKVRVNCTVTGSQKAISWTGERSVGPVIRTLPVTLLVEIPMQYAKGRFECVAQCSKTTEKGDIQLELFSQQNLTAISTVVIVLGTVLVVLVVHRLCCYYHSRLQCRRGAAQLGRRVSWRARARDLLTNGDAVEMARP